MPVSHTRYGCAVNRRIRRVVTQALAQVDVVAHVDEAGKWSPGDAQLLPLLPKGDKTILVVNKVDAIKNKNDMFAYVGKIMEQHAYSAVVPVSALRGVPLAHIFSAIDARLPAGDPLLEADTDRQSVG